MENEDLKNFIYLLNRNKKLSSRKTLGSKIKNDSYSTTMDKRESLLPNSEYVSITLDILTSSQYFLL